MLHQLKEHRRAVFQGYCNSSALAEHSVTSGHEIDWDGATILDYSDWHYPRLYLESWHIQQQDNTLNRESSISPLVYKGLTNIS